MANPNDTSAIDEKKEENSLSTKNDFLSNIGGFFQTVVILCIIISLYCVGSGCLLYACKLGQSNILPTEIHCSPYTEIKPNIQPIQTNIFTTSTEPPLSMKMNFPYNEYNSSNKILNIFREYKNESKSHFLANYFISIMESILQFNYASFNTILNLLNSNLPESLIILFGPIIVGFLSTVLFFVDNLYLIYLWFSNMKWFFKKNTNISTTGPPKWEDVTVYDIFKYCCAIGLVILFIIVFFFAFPFLSVISMLALSWCMISCILYKAEMYGKSITVSKIIQDIFKYYKISIMGIFSFFVIVSAFSKLGTVPGIFAVLTLALIYFGILTIDIFKPINKENLSPEVSYEQAKKTCSFKEPVKEKHGFLYDILLGQNGGNITKELKNIGKKLYR